MRKLIVLLLALASVSPLYAAPDQVQQTIIACGRPLRSYLGPTDTSTPIAERILVFRDGHTVFFDRSSGVPIFRRVSNGNRAFRFVDEARKEMPCLAQTDFAAPIGSTRLHVPSRASADISKTMLGGSMIFVLILIVCGLGLYFLPCIIAGFRKVDKSAGIVLVNVFLGWTFLGWLVALIWAFTAETRDQAAIRDIAFRNVAMQQPYPPTTYNPNLPR